MKNVQDKAKATKALPEPAAPSASFQDQRKITIPADPAAQRRVVKDVFVKRAGASVFAAQMRPFVMAVAGQDDRLSAELFMEAIRESVQPRDAIEEMLVVQMAWTHARLARLSGIAHDQEQRRNVQVVHDACDRAANTFRRQMLTLAEYRRPAQPNNFVAIRQANVANQQVVQNAETQNPQNAKTSNEQGSAPAALPPVASGIELTAGNGVEVQTMVAEHRPQNGGGQRPFQTQCDEARRA